MPSPEEDGRDPVDRSRSPDEPAEMHTDRGSVGESGPTLSASSAPVPHHRVNIQKIGSNRDLSLVTSGGPVSLFLPLETADGRGSTTVELGQLQREYAISSAVMYGPDCSGRGQPVAVLGIPDGARPCGKTVPIDRTNTQAVEKNPLMVVALWSQNSCHRPLMTRP